MVSGMFWSADLRGTPHIIGCNLRSTFLRVRALLLFLWKWSTGKRFSTRYALFPIIYLFRIYILVLSWVRFVLITLFCSFRRWRFTISEAQHNLQKYVFWPEPWNRGKLLDPSCLAYSISFSHYSAFYVLCSTDFFPGVSPFLLLMDPKFCPCRYQPYL